MQKMRISGGERTQQTVKVNSSDSSQTLSEKGVTIAIAGAAVTPGLTAINAIISVDIHEVRVGFGTVSITVGHLLKVGDTVYLQGEREVKTAEFISAVAGAHADLQVSVEY